MLSQPCEKAVAVQLTTQGACSHPEGRGTVSRWVAYRTQAEGEENVGSTAEIFTHISILYKAILFFQYPLQSAWMGMSLNADAALFPSSLT